MILIVVDCFHIKPFICEDSEQLLEFMRSSEPDEDIPDPPEDDDNDKGVEAEVRRFRRRHQG